MQVKLDTYHWGIQWNSVAMLVKKATFQRMGSGEKGRTENRWDVSGAAQCITESISYISTVSTSRERLTVGATTDVFLVKLQSAVL
jgi:hypothetical protein